MGHVPKPFSPSAPKGNAMHPASVALIVLTCAHRNRSKQSFVVQYLFPMSQIDSCTYPNFYTIASVCRHDNKSKIMYEPVLLQEMGGGLCRARANTFLIRTMVIN